MQISWQSLTASVETFDLDSLDRRVRQTMDRDIDRSGRSREQVADRMGVSVHQLNAWLAPSRRNSRFPCVLLSLFCEATGSDALKRLILGPQLCELLELGERAAAILDERARRRVLKTPTNGFSAGRKRNGSASCARQPHFATKLRVNHPAFPSPALAVP